MRSHSTHAIVAPRVARRQAASRDRRSPARITHARQRVEGLLPLPQRRGQLLPPGATAPVFGPSAAVDFELEVVRGSSANAHAVSAHGRATMEGPRRSQRKRTQTDFVGATEVERTGRDQLSERRAREAAVASAYEPLVGLKRLGGGGGEGRVWVGEPALGGFAPLADDRQRFLDLAPPPLAPLPQPGLHTHLGPYHVSIMSFARCVWQPHCAGCLPLRGCAAGLARLWLRSDV
jgi:hypothetical protein